MLQDIPQTCGALPWQFCLPFIFFWAVSEAQMLRHRNIFLGQTIAVLEYVSTFYDFLGMFSLLIFLFFILISVVLLLKWTYCNGTYCLYIYKDTYVHVHTYIPLFLL